MSRCKYCDPRTCGPAYLYVAVDHGLGLVKIGCSKRPARRLASYRSTGSAITFEHKREAGCEWTAWDREQRALRALARVATRVRGDWFRATADQARECVEAACASYKGVRFK